MNTPIHDFVKAYVSSAPARFHMPGHKGRGPLGCEALDLTEIPGADSLYEADGVIAESEANASRLFGCPTFYSTEGSSHCIRAMLALAMQYAKAFPLRGRWHPASPASRMTDEVVSDAHGNGRERIATASVRTGLAMTGLKRFRVLAARNVHRTFLSAAALLDLDVCWLPLSEDSYLSADVTPELLEAALAETGADAVYLTCPDYLGDLPDLGPLAEICHAHGALLLVDNAHGAYLRFLRPSRHPMDLGADLCCDSAHKTLPVLTGGAYLHLKAGLAAAQAAKDALALFGSTSPSYLILQSLDLVNPYLETLPEKLAEVVPKLGALKKELSAAGCRLYGQEPLKLTLDLRGTALTGTELARRLEEAGVFCEFADPDFAVFMLAPAHTDEELARLRAALLGQASGIRDQASGDGGYEAAGGGRQAAVCRSADDGHPSDPHRSFILNSQFSPVCSIRTAMLSPCERIPAERSLGRILARPGVSCPPAVPILMPGERIDEAALAAFRHYGIETCSVLPEFQ